jgi:hypothetical protein
MHTCIHIHVYKYKHIYIHQTCTSSKCFSAMPCLDNWWSNVLAACMYVCIYVCMYIRMYVCMNVCMYACMHAYHAPIIDNCMCWRPVCMYVMHVSMHDACMHVLMHVYMIQIFLHPCQKACIHTAENFPAVMSLIPRPMASMSLLFCVFWINWRWWSFTPSTAIIWYMYICTNTCVYVHIYMYM